jgi:hypothetical protein
VTNLELPRGTSAARARRGLRSASIRPTRVITRRAARLTSPTRSRSPPRCPWRRARRSGATRPPSTTSRTSTRPTSAAPSPA